MKCSEVRTYREFYDRFLARNNLTHIRFHAFRVNMCSIREIVWSCKHSRSDTTRRGRRWYSAAGISARDGRAAFRLRRKRRYGR